MKMDPQDYPFRRVTHRPGFLAGNDAAAEWCALGFGWLYAFNQEEAVHCFRRATRLAPPCRQGHHLILLSVCRGHEPSIP